MAQLDRREKIAWLRLARTQGIGPTHATRLIERFLTASEAVAALPRLLATGTWGGGAVADAGEAERELDLIEDGGAALLARADPGFPEPLRGIADPPVLLIVRGDPALLAGPAVALVGARNASANGRLIAEAMARELAAAGAVVVSGLARGIDTAAHRGALQGGTTIAVVAGGADVAYPEENAALMEAIAGQGAVVSERPLGAIPRARDFPRRNRIIAGLTSAVVVVEAAPQSGSLITARLATEQGRDVMAVPGSPLDPRHRGTNQLLKDGATLVEDAADVLGQLGPVVRRSAAPPRPVAAGAALRPGRRPATPARPAPTPAAPTPAPAVGTAGRLLAGLGPDPVAVDELVRLCEASVAEVQDALLDLELEGRLERHPGNRVSLRPG